MATDYSQMMIDLGGLKDWSPYEGIGSNDLLTHDGVFGAVVEKYKLDVSDGGKGKLMLVVRCTVTDEDNKGKGLVSNVMLSGTDKDGKPMIRQFGDFLASVGYTKDQITQSFATLGQKPAAAVLESLKLVGRTLALEAEFDTYNGTDHSKIKNWVTPDNFAKSKAAVANRRAHRKIVAAGPQVPGSAIPLSASLPALGGPAQLNMPTLTAPTLSTPAVDPLAALAGLGQIRQ